MKFYQAKHALTRGIVEVDGLEPKSSCPAPIAPLKKGQYEWCLDETLAKDGWFRTREEALKHAEHLRDQKIKYHEKQIEKARAIKFS